MKACCTAEFQVASAAAFMSLMDHEMKCSWRAFFICFLLRERTPPEGRNQRLSPFRRPLDGPASREGAGRTGRAGRAKAQRRGAPNREPRRLLSQVGKWKGDSQDPDKPAPVSRILDARALVGCA
jgi:hypothetical protein